jgi:bacterioferritin-associated ferredoxin
MYVCICNGYRDCEIKAVAQQGLRSAHAVYQSLGAGPRCGRCLSTAQRVIDEHTVAAETRGPLTVSAQVGL